LVQERLREEYAAARSTGLSKRFGGCGADGIDLPWQKASASA
jgi:hypothetical protein